MNSTPLDLDMRPQPDDVSCGPTCLHAVYRYHGDRCELPAIIDEVRNLESGGTLAAWLGYHALGRGYRATLTTCNLSLFDPSWFAESGEVDLAAKLVQQARAKSDVRLQAATRAYLSFLRRGGRIEMGDLTPARIAGWLQQGLPVIAGLSATWLQQAMRERPWDEEYDDILGRSAGHFVLINGYHASDDSFTLSDPMLRSGDRDRRGGETRVSALRLLGAIYLGVLTHDADLLILEPGKEA